MGNTVTSVGNTLSGAITSLVSPSREEIQRLAEEDRQRKLRTERLDAKFVARDQSSDVMNRLLLAFERNRPDDAQEIIRMIGEKLVPFAPTDVFRGSVAVGFLRDGFPSLLECDLGEHLHNGRLYVDGVKPYVLAYVFTLYTVYALAEDLDRERGGRWFDVFTEMRALSDPRLDDTVFGIPLLHYLLWKPVDVLVLRGADRDKLLRRCPFAYESAVFRTLLTDIGPVLLERALGPDPIETLIRQGRHQLLEDLLAVTDCTKWMTRNHLHLIAREGLGGDEVKFIRILTEGKRHKQDPHLKVDGEDCLRLAIRHKRWDQVSHYMEHAGGPGPDSLLTLCQVLDTDDYTTRTEATVDGIMRTMVRATSPDPKPFVEILFRKGLYTVARNVVAWSRETGPEKN